MLGADLSGARTGQLRLGRVVVAAPAPVPGVAKPQGRQHVDRRPLGPAIGDGDPDEDVLGRRLRVLDAHVEVAIAVQHPRVDELELGLVFAASAVLLQQALVGVGRLGILVQRLEIRVGRRRVEVVVELFDVFAVVAFRSGEPEQPLLEDRISLVPQREREGEAALVVADAQQAVFAPAVGPAPGLVVREILPAVAVRRVILPHRPPLTLGQVGAPALPGLLLLCGLLQAGGFLSWHACLSWSRPARLPHVGKRTRRAAGRSGVEMQPVADRFPDAARRRGIEQRS